MKNGATAEALRVIELYRIGRVRFVRFVNDPGYVTAHVVPVTLCDSPAPRRSPVLWSNVLVPPVSCYRRPLAKARSCRIPPPSAQYQVGSRSVVHTYAIVSASNGCTKQSDKSRSIFFFYFFSSKEVSVHTRGGSEGKGSPRAGGNHVTLHAANTRGVLRRQLGAVWRSCAVGSSPCPRRKLGFSVLRAEGRPPSSPAQLPPSAASP